MKGRGGQVPRRGARTFDLSAGPDQGPAIVPPRHFDSRCPRRPHIGHFSMVFSGGPTHPTAAGPRGRCDAGRDLRPHLRLAESLGGALGGALRPAVPNAGACGQGPWPRAPDDMGAWVHGGQPAPQGRRGPWKQRARLKRPGHRLQVSRRGEGRGAVAAGGGWRRPDARTAQGHHTQQLRARAQAVRGPGHGSHTTWGDGGVRAVACARGWGCTGHRGVTVRQRPWPWAPHVPVSRRGAGLRRLRRLWVNAPPGRQEDTGASHPAATGAGAAGQGPWPRAPGDMGA